MTRSPRVEIVVAAFCQPALLRQALASVRAQVCEDYAVVVSDDSASEEVRAVVAEQGDRRFRYRANGTPLGPAGNHRVALAECTSRWVAILNHDDHWEPGFLSTLLPLVESDSDAVVAFCDHAFIDAEGALLVAETEAASRRYGRSELAPGRHRPFFDLIASQAIPIACSAIFRREAIPSVEPPDEVGGAYDLWLAFRLASTGGAAHYVQARLAAWRLHNLSLGERRDVAGTLAIAECWERVNRESADRELCRVARRRASSAFLVGARQWLASGNRAGARALARRASRSVTTAGALVLLLLSVAPPAIVRHALLRSRTAPRPGRGDGPSA